MKRDVHPGAGASDTAAAERAMRVRQWTQSEVVTAETWSALVAQTFPADAEGERPFAQWRGPTFVLNEQLLADLRRRFGPAPPVTVKQEEEDPESDTIGPESEEDSRDEQADYLDPDEYEPPPPPTEVEKHAWAVAQLRGWVRALLSNLPVLHHTDVALRVARNARAVAGTLQVMRQYDDTVTVWACIGTSTLALDGRASPAYWLAAAWPALGDHVDYVFRSPETLQTLMGRMPPERRHVIVYVTDVVTGDKAERRLLGTFERLATERDKQGVLVRNMEVYMVGAYSAAADLSDDHGPPMEALNVEARTLSAALAGQRSELGMKLLAARDPATLTPDERLLQPFARVFKTPIPIVLHSDLRGAEPGDAWWQLLTAPTLMADDAVTTYTQSPGFVGIAAVLPPRCVRRAPADWEDAPPLRPQDPDPEKPFVVDLVQDDDDDEIMPVEAEQVTDWITRFVWHMGPAAGAKGVVPSLAKLRVYATGHCDYCHKRIGRHGAQVCPRCEAARYCSKACRDSDAAVHTHVCVPLPAKPAPPQEGDKPAQQVITDEDDAETVDYI